ncbi:hypothetical protein GLOIN_2v1870609 [Rhizophagus irregularis DAOM 181602=DAOM 197198]|nr:hypothetical protein GLOIN_2v1870609 [Rhizophagus irregularis DAOM 181602=DAOM 197198]
MIRDLIKKPRKTEHESIWKLRRAVIVVFLMILVGSFVVMSIRIARENPTISTTFASVNNVLAPSIYLSLPYNFSISCQIYYDYNGINDTSCDEYITQPKSTGDSDYPYGGNFSPEGIELTRYDDTGPYFVFLIINITDPTFNVLTEPFFRMTLYDSDDGLSDFERINKTKSDSLISPFEESLFYLNKYTLTGGYFYKLGFSRKIRKVIRHPFWSFIGFPSNYLLLPYIESSIQGVPAASLDATRLKVRISPRDFIVEEEQEQRNDTIIGALGVIAAFYSSAVFIYVFLFGVDSMKPWGVIHDGCCGFKRFKRESVEILAWESSPDTEDIDRRVEALEKFRDFLRETIVLTVIAMTPSIAMSKSQYMRSKFTIIRSTDQVKINSLLAYIVTNHFYAPKPIKLKNN